MDTEVQNISAKDKFIGFFRDDEKDGIIGPIRKEALAKFEESGFPTLKNEDWKYTSLAGFQKIDWQLYPDFDHSHIQFSEIEHFLIPNITTNLLVFIHGKWAKHLSIIHEPKPEILITSFAVALNEYPEVIENHFAKYADYKKNAFSALNTALATDGAFIHVPKGFHLQFPVQILNISGYGMENGAAHTRNLIVLEENTKAEFIENNVSIGNHISFSNIVSEIVVSKSAQLNYYKNQVENSSAYHVNLTQIHQKSHSLCNTYSICLGGKFLRNDLNFELGDAHCESHLYGLYISNGQQLIDNHTFVDHAKPECFSNELYKGIMADKSTAVFNGKIIVRPDAQKTNAYQSNKNILLSDEARINTKPQLEIFADDVKCSHGATTGQLDDEALFYLRSRGINENTARAMLTLAFAEDVLANIKEERIKGYFEKLVSDKLS